MHNNRPIKLFLDFAALVRLVKHRIGLLLWLAIGPYILFSVF